jgi:thiol-disulfide isomerase/thioredoxin
MRNGIVYAAVAVLAGTAGFFIYRLLETQPAARADASPAAASQALPETLPDFTLDDRTGSPRSIRSWPGKSMIVNFWATWCAPCRREIPLLRKIQSQHGSEGFQVVGVAVDFREDVIKYADKIGLDYPLLMGEQDGLDAVNRFGLPSVGFPFTVFTDSEGRVVTLHLGELTAAQADVILAAVAAVNRGESTVAQARTRVAAGLAALDNAPG